jgi:tRNA(Arg) A34 adenosine deaminase TadA
MKKAKSIFIFHLFLYCSVTAIAQQQITEDTVPQSYFVTYSRAEYMQKLAALPFGIKETDSTATVIKKLEIFLAGYKPSKKYTDDVYAKASATEALKGIKEGGYGIAALLIDSSGKIVESAHNSQLQLHRSDLHGEMALLTKFEQKNTARKYQNEYTLKPGLTVFSSAEPCPMCFMRLAIAGVNTKYCTPGPDDGMVNRVNCLPPAWVALAAKQKFTKANAAPVMQKLAHLLFFSFLLDNRGPKN